MARGLSNITNDIKNIFTRASQGVGDFFTKKRGPNNVSIVDAVKMTAPTVAQDFGNALAGRDRSGNLRPGPNIARIPVIKQAARAAGNTGQTVGSGVVDITRGAYHIAKPGIKRVALGDRLKGAGEIVYGGAKIVSANPTNPAGKVFQLSNIASQLPNNKVQRLASGIMRGQTGIKTLSPETESKKKTYKVAGQEFSIDPLELAGELYGFTRNPVNAKIFKATEGFNLIPGAKGFAAKAANFLLTNAGRGATEDVLMSLKDIPSNASPQEKAKFLLENAAFGATAEIIFRGGAEGAQKGVKNLVSTKQMAKVFDELKKLVTKDTKVTLNEEPVQDAVKLVGKYLRDTKGRFAGKIASLPDEAMSALERLARDPDVNLAELPAKVRKAVNEFRFENDIDITDIRSKAGKLPLFTQDPEVDTRYLRTQRAKSRLASAEAPQQAFGAVAGIEPEYDDEGNFKGYKYNPVTGVAGLAVSSPQVRKTVGDTLKPKTALLEQADDLFKSGQEELLANREAANLAKEARSMFSDDMIKKINQVKSMFRRNAAGDIETLRAKNPNLIESVTQAVRENPMYEALTDEDALRVALELPTKADTVATTPQDIIDARELKRQANEVWDLVYNSETDPIISAQVIKNEQQALEKAADYDFKEWQRYMFNQEGATLTPAQNTRRNIDAIADAIKQNTGPSFTKNVEQLNDIGGFSRGWRDVFRNFKAVFGDGYGQVKAQVLDPFDAAKGQFVDGLNRHADAMEESIIKGLNIKKGSKESAAVQLFGEGKITEEQLVSQFGDEGAARIIQADQWFRNQYDSLLDEVNAVRAQIYPNNPDKLIPKRENYYRHFREMSQGIEGLKNIFESPAGIQSSLAGTSEYVKPKSKWLSFAQRRIGDATDVDAVAGFIDYVKAAEYAKAIDPQIDRFRQLRNELIEATAPELPGGAPNPNAGKLNNFIEFLDDFSNDLAGKTNPIDRALTKLGPSRKALKVLDWVNSRVKANLILGNLSSSIAQFFNVPQGLAEAGPKYSAMGVKSSLTDVIANDSKLTDASTFLKERYGAGSAFDRFDEGIAANTKKFAAWMTGALDEVGTKLIWHANYQKAIAEGIENPIKYADDVARDMVAGRGIGEVPLAQKSKVVQLFMPFQLEVGNTWHVLKGWADEKAVQKFLYFTVASFILNRGAEQIRGNDVSFDPLNALLEGIDEFQDEANPKIGALKAVGRVGGEVLSNIPGGQTVASIYPETGVRLGNEQLTREELFGEGDPTRYGSGLLAIKGLQDPIFKLVTPYGGQQIKRTIEGTKAVAEGAVKSKNGQVQFPVDQDLGATLQSVAFGKYATPNARFYFKEELTPLSEKETALWQQAVDSGEDPVKAWAALYQAKLVRSLPSKMMTISRDPSVPQDERRRAVTNLVNQYKEINAKLENMGNLDATDFEGNVAGEKEQTSLDPFVAPTGLLANNGSVYRKGRKPRAPSKPKAPTLKIKSISSSQRSRSPVVRTRQNAATVQDFL